MRGGSISKSPPKLGGVPLAGRGPVKTFGITASNILKKINHDFKDADRTSVPVNRISHPAGSCTLYSKISTLKSIL